MPWPTHKFLTKAPLTEPDPALEKAFKDQKDVTENLFNRSDEELFEMRFNGSGNRT